MGKNPVANGVWPTMITPYTPSNEIDEATLAKQIDWYVQRGVAGLFAVCQSSEMFFLSQRERVDLAKACVKFSGGRAPVLASGHVSETIRDQIDELNAMADTGVVAVVLITNRLAGKHEDDDVFIRNLEKVLKGVRADMPLGFYECPYPYKRLVSPRVMKFALESGRFAFLKDTSCSRENIRAKLELARGSEFKLFNANAATLLDSLKMGGAGYSGVMANFHPELYVRLCRHWSEDAAAAQRLQDFIGFASTIENQVYPVNAMYAMQLAGIPFQLKSRRVDAATFTEANRLEIEQMMRISAEWSARYPG